MWKHVYHMYSVGGYDGQSFLDTVECYDPSTKLWSILQPMTCRRSKQMQTVVLLVSVLCTLHVQLYVTCNSVCSHVCY